MNLPINQITEYPIIFSSESVKAILDGRKTQTRRIIKLPKEPKEGCGKANWDLATKPQWAKDNEFAFIDMAFPTDTYPTMARCSYGKVGDLLWVKEGWACAGDIRMQARGAVVYKADYGDTGKFKFKSPIHMPKWAARIWLEITGIKVETLQEITIEDIWAEGRSPSLSDDEDYSAGYEWFADLWDSINAKRGFGWESNPWVWVIEFKKSAESAKSAINND